mmetsp:Transcript_22570/g.34653  ORF Transcript_22570/g.34653 Transcript_22570/m.34653 type:complete len:976 (-) Transcript_22570:131-3058(-)
MKNIFKKKKKKKAIEDEEDSMAASSSDDDQEWMLQFLPDEGGENGEDDGLTPEQRKQKLEEEEEEQRIQKKLREAKTEMGLGKVNIENKQLREARDNYSFAYKIYQDLLHEGPEDEKAIKKYNKLSADCRGKLGEIHLILGDFNSAKQYFSEAQNTYNIYEPEYEMESNLIRKLFGDVHFMVGEDEEAKVVYRDAVNVLEREEYLGWANKEIGEIYKRLAELHLDDCEWNETLKYYRNAVSSKQNAEDIGPEHPDYAELQYGNGMALEKFAEYCKELEDMEEKRRKGTQVGKTLAIEEAKNEDTTDMNNSEGMKSILKSKSSSPVAKKDEEEVKSRKHYLFAVSAFQTARGVYEKLNKKEYEDELADVLHHLGICNRALGNRKEALQFLEQELKMISKMRKEVRPSVLHIAETLEATGSLHLEDEHTKEKALDLLKKALKTYKCVKEIKPEVLASINTKVARAHYRQENFDDAIVCLKEAMKIVKREFGKISLQNAAIHTKFGHNYLALMRYADATKHYEAALQIQVKRAEASIDGRPRNMDIVRLLICLGHVHYEANFFDKSLGCYIEALDSYKELASDEPIGLKKIYNNMGHIYYTLGDFIQASISYNDALMLTTPGGSKEDIIEIATLLNNLGNVLFHLRAFEEAQNFYLRAFKVKRHLCKEDDTPDYSNVANSLYNMGTVCLKMGNLEGSLIYFQKAREMHEESDPHALQIADICSQMGNVHLRLKQYDEALQEHHTALSIRKDVLGPSNADVSATCHHIANVCYAEEDYDKALSFYNVALKVKEDRVDDALFGNIYHSMGNTYAKTGDVEKAVASYKRSLEFKRQSQPISASVARTLRNIALLIKDTDPTEANNLISDTLEITRAVMGTDHPMVAKILVDKAKLQLRSGTEDEKRAACKCLSEADRILMSVQDSSGKGSVDLRALRKDLNRYWKKLGGKEVYVAAESFFGTSNEDGLEQKSLSLYSSSGQ